MNAFMYAGERVFVAPRADIPRFLRPDGNDADLVQKALNMAWAERPEPLPKGRDELTIFEYKVNSRLLPTAVPLKLREQPRWGIHVGHTAKTPGPSPFVDRLTGRQFSVGYLTIEFAGAMLVRAYGGHYTPPLPWMNSARDAEGGRAACVDYWCEHAYFSPGYRLISTRAADVARTQAPEWFRRSLAA